MIRIIDEDIEDKTTNFLVYNIKTCVINSLRRIMMADYKNSAFDESNIIVHKNTSLLHNEIIRHRLSLVPINTKDTVKISLNIKNTEKDILNIYSNDIKIIEGEGKIMKDILLYKLKKNQEISLDAKSDMNTSGEAGIHYRPISTAYFKIVKQINISNKVSKENFKSIKKYLIEEYELFEEKNIYSKSKGYKTIGLTHTIRDKINIIKNIIEKFNLKNDELTIEHLEYNKSPVYSFNIESLFINPTEILQKSIQIFKQQLDKFLESEMEVEEEQHFIKLFVKNGTYTISNPLSWFLKENDKIKFAHYNKLHPLDDFLIIQLSLHNNSDNYIAILQDTLEYLNNYIDNILTFDIFNKIL